MFLIMNWLVQNEGGETSLLTLLLVFAQVIHDVSSNLFSVGPAEPLTDDVPQRFECLPALSKLYVSFFYILKICFVMRHAGIYDTI